MVVSKALSASSDGRGGEPVSVLHRRLGNPGEEKLHIITYVVYYRLYTNNGALKLSNNPIYSNDRFISRILSRSVTPPHTVASLKRHICRIEGFESSGSDVSYNLYSSLSEKVPLDDSARLSLRGDPGLGSSETNPMALVIEVSAVEKRSTAASTLDPKTLPEWSDEPRYVYYRVYDQGGEVASKTSFNKIDFSLGRVDTLSIPPPHIISSLRSRVLQAEEASNQAIQLFEDDFGETIMHDADYPGIKEDEPVAIVYQSERTTSTSEPKISASPQPSSFSKQIKLLPGCVDWKSPDPAWHDLTVGEVLKTDGVTRTEMLHTTPVQTRQCYVAINSGGKKAFVISGWMGFC